MRFVNPNLSRIEPKTANEKLKPTVARSDAAKQFLCSRRKK